MPGPKQTQLAQEQEEWSQILQSPGQQKRSQAEGGLIEALKKHLDKIMAITLVILMVLFFLETSVQSSPFPSHRSNSTLQDHHINQKDSHSTTHKNHLKIQPSLQAEIIGKDEQYSENGGNPQTENNDLPTPEFPFERSSNAVDEQKLGFMKRRSQILKRHEKQAHLQSLPLARYNMELPDDSRQREILFKEEERKLEDRYHMSQFPEELSMCAVVYASGNGKPYAHEFVLNSLLGQQYQSYLVVYVADGHSYSQAQKVRQFLSQRDRRKSVIFMWNPDIKYYLQSVLLAIRSHCTKKKVTMLIDGDDELLGHQVFRLFNTYYNRFGANLVYGNFIEFHQERDLLRLGFSSQYEYDQKHQNSYRRVGQKFGSLKTFKTKLLEFIKEDDFKDSLGQYYKYAGDYALMYPLLQLSCAEVRYLPQFNYLYYGYQLDPIFGTVQINNGRSIKEKKPYECFKKYV